MKLHLNKPLFENYISLVSQTEDIDEAIILKDYFVTLALKHIYSIHSDLVFIGGTSLSKCFNIIDRFSEDIDLVASAKSRKAKQKATFEIINELTSIWPWKSESNTRFSDFKEMFLYYDTNKKSDLDQIHLFHRLWIGYNKLDKNRIDMLSSYVLIYFILFIPTPIFDRPIYFLHGYIAIALSLIIYNIIYLLFEIILSKQAIETDKTLLSMQVSTLSKATETIATIAKSDTLTGLKNRYALYKEIDQLIKENTPFLLLFMDLNQLKMINDEYCHKQGDKYLAQFARTMSDLLMNDGTSYRFAGDEFIAILTNNMEMFNPDKFKLEVAQHINLDVPYLGFSIGLASFPSDGLTLDELIDIADKCMYQDKRG